MEPLIDPGGGAGPVSLFGNWGKIADCIVGQEKVTTLKCLPALFQNLINAAFFFVGFLALVFIIVSGIRLILSGGDPKQVEEARKTLTYAILGLLLVLLSAFIINLIAFVTGASCITVFGFESCR